MLWLVAEYAGHYRGRIHYGLTAEPRFGWLLALLGLIWVATYAIGINESGISALNRLARAAGAVIGAVVLVVLAEVFFRHHAVPVLEIPVFDLGMCLVLLVPVLTAVSSLADRTLVRQGQHERVLALVSHDEEDRLLRDFNRNPERPAHLVLTLAPSEVLPTEQRPAPLGDMIEEHKATLLVMSREAQAMEAVVSQAVVAHSKGVRIRTLSLFYDEWLGKLPISELERIALLFDINEIHRPVYARMKRALDIALAAAGAVVLVVAVPFVLLADLAGNRGSLFYTQPRVGKNGTVFTIVKFRTMRNVDAPAAWTSEDDPRLGRVGKILRKMHVDELPQVINVLKRDMSIVGPRPEQPHYVEQLSETIPFYDVRHLVRPGITGWAQVKYDYGASELDALEKLQYEFYYLRHQDLALDLRTMGRTVRSMVRGEGR